VCVGIDDVEQDSPILPQFPNSSTNEGIYAQFCTT
jgi:hypothetical protein